ncbi:indolepyruvate decarboxylase [Scopulibacillus daqui]|uniref:Alpha-keto-acid decarboxylase n=1 Tax=Scopulibacillus daqui TaxID=1469162 RepID=A0ABS2PYT0_9BACL|nr:alpha-keto acid decarboxylase family protein [Scopulibacillus daqui]MBM7644467.1 indolepyruvate decarboxylase [Scopulibacillus daqui]
MHSTTCTVGDYLLLRLKEMGVKHIFGVPGDFNLGFLDQIEAMDHLEWIGNCNELNAAYAADGYARINGIAALVTTFGVGELSAINGIAGSYAEQLPVVKITGSPATNVANSGAYVHHTLGDGDFTHFNKMFKEVTVAQTTLTEENAAEEIDRVLQECWLYKRPVYINLPSDISYKKIEAPKSPLHLPEFTSETGQLNTFLKLALQKINQAKFPVILADYEVNRYQLNEKLKAFVNQSGFPVASLSMGKGVIDETHPQFIGVYTGSLSDPYVRSRIEDADCILSIGVKLTDSLTGGFTHQLDEDKLIEIHPSYAKINQETFDKVSMSDLLELLTEGVEPRDIDTQNIQPFCRRETADEFVPTDKPLTQERFWKQLNSFLNKEDVLLAEQGTAFFGTSQMVLPEKSTFIGQPLWGSIGYTLPSLLGTQIADPNRRNILVIGDGSFQLTAQELSTILKNQLKPIIILINNDGYVVERAIHGPNEKYNDINMWKYSRLPEVLDMGENSISMVAANEKEFADALHLADSQDKLVFIEVTMERLDVPELLDALGKVFAKQNAY